MSPVTRRASAAVLVGIAVLITLPFAAGYLLPQRGFLLIGLASFAGWGTAPLALLVVIALVLRQRLLAALLAAVLGVQVAVLAPSYVADDRPGRGDELTVMSVNMFNGTADTDDLVRVVRERRVDVLAVLELTPAALARLRASGLERLLPYAQTSPSGGAAGAGLWARRALTAVPAWPGRFRGVAADLDAAGARLRVRAVHAFPPARGFVATWERDYAGLTHAARAETTGPTLLLGDFNASVHHRRLRALMAGRWRDAAALAGAGLVRTWGPRIGGPAVVDPDHVLLDRGMGIEAFAVVRVRGTDHRAVLATVVLATRP